MDGRATYPSPERGGSHCLFASTEEGFGRVLIRGKRGEARRAAGEDGGEGRTGLAVWRGANCWRKEVKAPSFFSNLNQYPLPP
jgi:hypothetical protein